MAATHAGPGAPPHPPSPPPTSPPPSAGDSPHQGHGGHCATPGGLNTATQRSHGKQTVRSQFSRQETAEERLDVNLTQFEFEERLSDSCPECPTKEIGKHCIELTEKEIEGVEYKKEKAELSGLSLCPSEEICEAAQLLQRVNAKGRKDKPTEPSAEQNTEEIAEPSAEQTPSQNTEEIAEPSAEQTPSQNTEEIAEPSAEQNTEEIAEPSAEQNTEEIAEPSAEQNTEEIAEPSAEQNTEEIAEPSAEQNTEEIAEPSAEQNTEEIAEPSAEQNTEEIAEPSAEQNTEEIAEPSAEQNTEEIAEPSAEQNTEEIAEPSAEQNTEEIAEPSAEQNTEEIAEPSAEQTPSQNTEEIAEPSAEQNTEEIAEQSAEQNTEEIAEEPLHANTGLGIKNSLHSDSKTRGFLKGTASSSQSVDANADIGSRKELAGTEEGISTETNPSRPATDGGGAGGGGGGGGGVSLLVYGLGNFASCLIARHQLALVLALRRHLQIRPGRCETFDPKYTDAEKQILVDLDFLEITTNEEGKRRVGGPTLVVMPHCGKALFNNLLWANWSPQHLQHLVVLGNSFSAMLDSLPRRLWPEHIGYIAKVRRQTREERVENSFVHRDVFNDLSVHWFPAHLLTHAPPVLWAHAPEPRYHTDVEIIVSHRPD